MSGLESYMTALWIIRDDAFCKKRWFYCLVTLHCENIHVWIPSYCCSSVNTGRAFIVFHYLIVMNSVAHCSWSGLEVTLFVTLSKHPRENCKMCSVSSVPQCFDWWIGIKYENGWRRHPIMWTFCRLFQVPKISASEVFFWTELRHLWQDYLCWLCG